jgi:hypothetical protein
MLEGFGHEVRLGDAVEVRRRARRRQKNDRRDAELILDLLLKGVVFYERDESRKNFPHAGGMKDSFRRQPPTYPSARKPGSRPLVSCASAGSES